MILIADSGSTKTDWVLISKNSSAHQIYSTVGYNPYFIDSIGITNSINENLKNNFDFNSIEEVYFYGAGCSNNEKRQSVKLALERCFVHAKHIFIGHDLLASARALLGNKPGFAAILGTGTNTCLFDGKEVSLNIDSLGFMLGDEGSGCYIGRKIVRDFMRNYLPADLQKSFKETFKIENNEQILSAVYSNKFPNRYLASFCKFAGDHIENKHIINIVQISFRDFFQNLVSKYPDYKKYELNCVGSVGFTFKHILEEVANAYEMKLGKVIRSPIDGLIDFHQNT